MSTLRGILVFLFSVGLFFSSRPASSLDVQTAFRQLASIPVDYYDYGVVCEQLARLQLYGTYHADTYRIDSGIIYTNPHGSTIGELDIVVFHKDSGKAVLIGEVKCWRDLNSALKKAKMQLSRFAGVLKQNRPIRMYNSYDKSQGYHKEQFQNQNMRSIYISQDGGEEHGFHMTIGLDHEEVYMLRNMLVKCQKSGPCPKVRYNKL